jgi:phospholipid/cholesterol/gamma-HCH transport system substrate-binding protein
VVLGLVVIAFVLALRSPNGVPGVAYRTMYAVVPDIGNLQRHSEVRVAGKRIGQVMQTQGWHGRVRVKLQLSPGAGPIPADSTVVVRSQGLLGQRYLQVRPGTSRHLLGDGATLRPAKNAITLGIPETLQTFDSQTRHQFGRMVNGLGVGLLGRGRDLNAAIAEAPDASTNFRRIVAAVTTSPGAARRLLPQLSRAAASFDAAQESTVAMLKPAEKALAPFVDHRAATQVALTEAPPALEAAQPALDDGRVLLTATRHLASAADRTLLGAPRALRATAALLRDSRRPLANVRPLLARARSAVPATLRIARALKPILAPLKQPLDTLTEPMRIIGAYGCDITSFAETWRSFLAFGVAGGTKIGPLGEIRSQPLFLQPAYGVKTPLIKRDLYPAPCEYRPSVYP